VASTISITRSSPATLALYVASDIRIHVQPPSSSPIRARLTSPAFAAPVDFTIPPNTSDTTCSVTAVHGTAPGQKHTITLAAVSNATASSRHATHLVSAPFPTVSFGTPAFDPGPHFEVGEQISFNLTYSGGRPLDKCALKITSAVFAEPVSFESGIGPPPNDTGKDIVATKACGTEQTALLEAVARATVVGTSTARFWVGPVLELTLVDPAKPLYAVGEKVKLRVKAMVPVRLKAVTAVVSCGAFDDTTFTLAVGAQECVKEVTLARPSRRPNNVAFKRGLRGCVASDAHKTLSLNVVAPPEVRFHHDAAVQPRRATHQVGDVVTITVSLASDAIPGGASFKVECGAFDPSPGAHPPSQAGVVFHAGSPPHAAISVAEGGATKTFQAKLAGTVGQRYPLTLVALAGCTVLSRSPSITIAAPPAVRLGSRSKSPVEPSTPAHANDTITLHVSLAEAAGAKGATVDLRCDAFPLQGGHRTVPCRFEAGEHEKAVSVRLDAAATVGRHPVTFDNLVGCTRASTPAAVSITVEAAPAPPLKVSFATSEASSAELAAYATNGANTASLKLVLSADAPGPVRAVITSSAFGGSVYAVSFAKGEREKTQTVRFAFANPVKQSVQVAGLSGCAADATADVGRANSPKNQLKVTVTGPTTNAVMPCPLVPGHTRLDAREPCNVETLKLIEKHGERHDEPAARSEEGVFEATGDATVLQVIGRRQSDEDFSEVKEKGPHTTFVGVALRSEGDEAYFCAGSDAGAVRHPMLTVQEVNGGARVDITSTEAPGDVSALAARKATVYEFEAFQAGFEKPEDDDTWWKKRVPQVRSLAETTMPFLGFWNAIRARGTTETRRYEVKAATCGLLQSGAPGRASVDAIVEVYPSDEYCFSFSMEPFEGQKFGAEGELFTGDGALKSQSETPTEDLSTGLVLYNPTQGVLVEDPPEQMGDDQGKVSVGDPGGEAPPEGIAAHVFRAVTGTVSTAGVASTTVTGTGTAFLDEVKIGDIFGVDPAERALEEHHVVVRIASDTSLVLSTPITLALNSAAGVFEAPPAEAPPPHLVPVYAFRAHEVSKATVVSGAPKVPLKADFPPTKYAFHAGDDGGGGGDVSTWDESHKHLGSERQKRDEEESSERAKEQQKKLERRRRKVEAINERESELQGRGQSLSEGLSKVREKHRDPLSLQAKEGVETISKAIDEYNPEKMIEARTKSLKDSASATLKDYLCFDPSVITSKVKISVTRNGHAGGIFAKKNKEHIEYLGKILKLVSDFFALFGEVQNSVPRFGFSAMFDVGAFEGELKWRWGWKEFTDRQVFFWEQVALNLNVFRVAMRLEFGARWHVMGLKFEAVAYLTLDMKLAWEKTFQREAPGASLAGDNAWTTARSAADVGLSAVLGHENFVSAGAVVKTGLRARVRWFHDERGGLEYEAFAMGVSAKITVTVVGYSAVDKEWTLVEGSGEDTPWRHGVFPGGHAKRYWALRREYEVIFAGLRAARKKVRDAQALLWEAQVELLKTRTSPPTPWPEVSSPEEDPGRWNTQWSLYKASYGRETQGVPWGDLGGYRGTIGDRLTKYTGLFEEAATKLQARRDAIETSMQTMVALDGRIGASEEDGDETDETRQHYAEELGAARADLKELLAGDLITPGREAPLETLIAGGATARKALLYYKTTRRHW
jgi:hypothetical protein